MQNPAQSLLSDDNHTRAIIGERLLLTLGSPSSIPGLTTRFKPSVKVTRSSPWKRVAIVLAASVFAPGFAYVGYLVSLHLAKNEPVAAIPVGLPNSLPIAEPGEMRVQVSDEEYQPGGPLPVPGGYAPVPLIPSNVPLPEIPPPAAPKGVSPPAKKEEEIKSAVLFDASATPEKSEPKQETKKEQPKPQEKPKAKDVKAAAPAVAPKTSLPPMPAAGAKRDEATLKLATPVDERPAKLSAQPAIQEPHKPSPSIAGASSAKVTLVDIAAGGSSVLVTNPATRLPMRLAVGDKLPNGKVIEVINDKSGSITAGGTTYSLD